MRVIISNIQFHVLVTASVLTVVSCQTEHLMADWKPHSLLAVLYKRILEGQLQRKHIQ